MTDDHRGSDQSIERINETFGAIPPADGHRWNLSTSFEDRLHLSRGSQGEYTLFLEGERPSFGNLGWLRNADYEPDAVDADNGRAFHALRLTAPGSGFGNRAIAHIAYEFVHLLTATPEIGNEALLLKAGWILELLGGSSDLLSPERQLGLAGECFLLWRLLEVGHANGIECGVVLERWRGEVHDRRDFAAAGISIEVKTSAQLARIHHINALSQLEPLAANERVYLYSLGVRRERLHDRKLPTFVDEVEALLVSASGSPDVQAIERFRSKLRSYGYDPAQREAYAYGPGLMLNENMRPRLFPVDALDCLRVSSFKEDRLPQMVREVSYSLELPEDVHSDLDEEGVLLSLIRAAAIE